MLMYVLIYLIISFSFLRNFQRMIHIEIIWYAHQDDDYRHYWLQYAVDWLRGVDPRGHFQMPGIR
jgi:hypothetical protein